MLNKDRHKSHWCPGALKLSCTLALSLTCANSASADNSFKLYMAPASNLPAVAVTRSKATTSPNSPVSPVSPVNPARIRAASPAPVAPDQDTLTLPTGTGTPGNAAGSAPVGKIYYPTSNGKPVVIDATQAPADAIQPAQLLNRAKVSAPKTQAQVIKAPIASSTAQSALKAISPPKDPALVAPGAIIHTSLDDLPAPSAPAKAATPSPTKEAFTGSAAPTQDPATNKHLGAQFSSDAQVKAIKEAEARRYDYVLPRTINSPVNFKVLQISGFITYLLSSDKLFINDHAVFAIKADKLLDELLPHVVKMSDHPMTIKVHTDNLGFDHYNTKLAKTRGELLRDWLIKHGSMRDVQIDVEGVGGTKPLVPNSLARGVDNPAGRAQNRRVEIFIDTNTSVKEKLAEARAAELAELAKEQQGKNEPKDKLKPGMTAGRLELQQASKGASDSLPAALMEVGPISDEGMEPGGEEETAQEPSHSPDGRQQANWDRVSDNQANKNLNAEGKRVMPAMTEKQKMMLQKERDWARGEFGLFLEK